MIILRINLVNPPNIEHTGTFRPPVNLAMLASYVRLHGHEVLIYDFEAQSLDSPLEIAEILMKNNPDVIGFTSLTPRIPIIWGIARACKHIRKDVKIVIGGSHVSGDPKSVFYELSIDYAIAGEGEEALLDLLNFLEKGKEVKDINNLAYRTKTSVIVNPTRPFIKNLDELPFPAWDLLPLERYKDPLLFSEKYMGINSARGCAWDCSFCASRVVWKGKVRFHSAENVMNQIRTLINDYDISNFYFYDDTFTMVRKRTLKICNLINREKLDIHFFAALRADTINSEIAFALKGAGCQVVYLGVESGDETILRETGKGVTKDQIRKAAACLKQADIPFFASFILGHPGDTHESIQATINFAKELDPDQAKFFIAVPFPGTRLYRIALEKGLITKDDEPTKFANYATYQHVPVNLSFVSDEELMQYQIKAYEEYDLRKRPIIR
jgi:radical SAM superfamily enzyme YgiQ (UPF0313 family)